MIFMIFHHSITSEWDFVGLRDIFFWLIMLKLSVHGVTEANGGKQKNSRMGKKSTRKWWIWPSCLPRQEVSGTIVDMKLPWMSSKRAEDYLRQQRESLAHHQVEKSLQEATAELTEGKEFRGFGWSEPIPLITLVLFETASSLAACASQDVVMLNYT